MKGLVFVQIKFEKYTTNFCFENSEVGIENDNCLSTALQQLSAKNDFFMETRLCYIFKPEKDMA